MTVLNLFHFYEFSDLTMLTPHRSDALSQFSGYPEKLSSKLAP